MTESDEDDNENKWHIEYFEDWLEFYQSVKERSVSTRKSEIRQFDEWAKENDVNTIEEVDYRTIKRFITEQKNQDFAPKTVAGRFQAIKNVVEEANRDGVIDEHPIPRDFDLQDDWGIDESKTLREQYLEEKGLSEGVSEEEFEQLRKNVTPPKTRNQCILDLLWTSGVRASELVEVRLDDIDFDNRLMTVPDKKKRDPNATRTVHYGRLCDQSLSAWLTDRKKYQCLKDADEDWLFCSRKTAPLYPERVTDAVQDAADNADIQQPLGNDARGREIQYINAHSLRHGHGTYAADKVGIHRVQKQLGHASVEMTESTYVNPDDDEDDENPYKDMY